MIVSNIIAEGNESYLSMSEKILDAINWRMRIESDGEIKLCPKPETVTSVYDENVNDILEMELSVTRDWFD